MPRPWIDAEFEVISAPLRIGDRHPRKRRWFYVGNDVFGRPLWYRPPILNKWQYGCAFLLGAFVAWLGWAYGSDWWLHHWPR